MYQIRFIMTTLDLCVSYVTVLYKFYHIYIFSVCAVSKNILHYDIQNCKYFACKDC